MKIKQKDIDFYAEFYRSAPARRKNNEAVKLISMLIITLAVLSGVVAYHKIKVRNLESEIQSANADIDELFSNDALNNANEINSEIDTLYLYKDNIDMLTEYISTLPHISEKFISEIKKFEASENPVTIKSCSFSTEKNSLSLEGYAFSPEDIASFVKSLRECGECYDVEYSGYKAENNIFSFSAVCIINDTSEPELTKEADDIEY